MVAPPLTEEQLLAAAPAGGRIIFLHGLSVIQWIILHRHPAKTVRPEHSFHLLGAGIVYTRLFKEKGSGNGREMLGETVAERRK